MKKTIDVSISGIAFVFDETAYRAMNAYLGKLERGYRDNPDGGEIIADIEARIAEIILGKIEPEQVVDERLVVDIIDRLGYPDDMDRTAGDPSPAPPMPPMPPVPPTTPLLPPRTFSRRLYRNPEGAKLGGVCSGIATFFNIDPVWVRLAFFVPLLLLIVTGPLGWGRLSSMLGVLVAAVFLLYFILWFIVPKARTPRQRLEMRGEPITVSTIEQNFREELSGKAAEGSPAARKSASVWAEILYVLGRIVLFALKAFAFLIGIVFALLSIGLIIALVTAIGWIISGATAMLFFGIPIMYPLLVVLGILIVLLPALMLTWVLFRTVFGLSCGRKAMIALGILWLIAAVAAGVVTVRNHETIRQSIENADSKGFWDRLEDKWEDKFDAKRSRKQRRDRSVPAVPADTTTGVIAGDSVRRDSLPGAPPARDAQWKEVQPRRIN